MGLGLGIAVETWLALIASPWFWLAVALFAALLAVVLLAPRRMRRRAELLRREPPG